MEATGMPFSIQVPLLPVRTIFHYGFLNCGAICIILGAGNEDRAPIPDEWCAVKVKRKRDNQEKYP
jgi:hypothetical protein